MKKRKEGRQESRKKIRKNGRWVRRDFIHSYIQEETAGERQYLGKEHVGSDGDKRRRRRRTRQHNTRREIEGVTERKAAEHPNSLPLLIPATPVLLHLLCHILHLTCPQRTPYLPTPVHVPLHSFLRL